MSRGGWNNYYATARIPGIVENSKAPKADLNKRREKALRTDQPEDRIESGEFKALGKD